MKGKAHVLKVLFLFQKKNVELHCHCHYASRYKNSSLFSTAAVCGTRLVLSEKVPRAREVMTEAKTAEEVLRKWGCSEAHVNQIFQRNPALRKGVAAVLESKLSLLSELGINVADLIKMIYRRPGFLSSHIDRHFVGRLDQLVSLFRSKDLVIRALVQNPSLLVYDFHEKVIPLFTLYEMMGVSREELISMLLHRPTLIQRTNFCEEKLEYIRKTGVTKESKMYKYVVTIMGVSRVETICGKVANLQKFGFSEDEVLQLVGRNPLLLTLSVEKVQRNMTFVVGTMKLPASIVLGHPFLLYTNLEAQLKPRVLLAGKIQDMGLEPQMKGSMMLRALRMTEKRFLNFFVHCHETEVKNELLQYYEASKCINRLAASSKKSSYTCKFPF